MSNANNTHTLIARAVAQVRAKGWAAPRNKSAARDDLRIVRDDLKKEGRRVTLKDLLEEWERQGAIQERRLAARRLPHAKDLEARLRWRLKAVAIAACPRNEREGANWTIHDAMLTDYDPKARAWVLHIEGWYEYSSRFGRRFLQASWLAGHDPDQASGYFCRRIPGSITKVAEHAPVTCPWPVKAVRQKVLPTGHGAD